MSSASRGPHGARAKRDQIFKRVRQYNLKRSRGKPRIGATHTGFLGHTISPAGEIPDGDKDSALTEMPDPTNVRQPRSLLGGLSYYRKLLKKTSRLLFDR